MKFAGGPPTLYSIGLLLQSNRSWRWTCSLVSLFFKLADFTMDRDVNWPYPR